MDITLGVPIAIHLETLVRQDDEVTKHVFDEPGKLVQMGHTLYIRYLETEAETGKKVPVTMKIFENGDVQLSRGKHDGAGHLRLLFSLNNRVVAHYETPYGIFPVETVTPVMKIRIKNQPVSGEIYIDYQLFTGETFIGDYKIQLIFTA